jgi:hypothetical protein
MANTNLTSSIITKEAQRILHQKLNFIGNINRQYDDSFAKKGAKIGSSLTVRLPNEFTVRTGSTYSSQDVTETGIDLTVATQKGIDFEFNSQELTMDIDSFGARYLEPAMSTLAANMEADALNMYQDVYNVVGTDGTAAALTTVWAARKALTDSLAPSSQRYVCLDTQSNVDLLTDTKGLFQSADNIKQQYREGMLGRTGGFDWFENTLMPRHQTGTAAATTGYLVNGASQEGSTLVVDGGTTTLQKGDVINITGVFRVHPETKENTGILQKFAITANSGTSATSLSITPAIVLTGGKQNVKLGPADNASLLKVVGGASAVFDQSLAPTWKCRVVLIWPLVK